MVLQVSHRWLTLLDRDGMLSARLKTKTSSTLLVSLSMAYDCVQDDDREWMDQASCLHMTNQFFAHECSSNCRKYRGTRCERSETGDSVRLCKAICAGCPALIECRVWVMMRGGIVHGVCGGLTQSQRVALRKDITKARRTDAY